MSWLRGFGTAALLATFAGCADPSLPASIASESYAGRVDGTDIAFAVTVDAETREVVLYVCGGADTFDRYSKWYQGSLDADDTVALSSKDGATARLSVTADGVDGSVFELDGTVLELAAPIAPEGSAIGLYDVVDEGCRTGVIVVSDDDVQGTWCSEEGIFAQVTPISPIVDVQSVRSGIEVEVTAPAEVQSNRRRLIARIVDPGDL